MMRSVVSIVTGWGGPLGTGHVQRMATLASYISRERQRRCVITGCTPPAFLPDSARGYFEQNIDRDTVLIIRDRRDSTSNEMTALKRIAPVIAVDDCGDGRLLADAAIDLLPNLKHPYRRNGPFICGYSFSEFIRAKPGQNIVKDVDVAIYSGPSPDDDSLMFFRSIIPDLSALLLAGGKAIPLCHLPSAAERMTPALALCASRVLITHFGITLYEGLRAGCRAITLNPTEYHSRLADIACDDLGIENLGITGDVGPAEASLVIRDLLQRPSRDSVRTDEIAASIDLGLERFCREIMEYL